mgnify:CR=1 FL=1
MIKLLLLLQFYLTYSLFYPESLNGKKILMNGPSNTNNERTSFDGNGHISSVVFDKDNTIVSELIIQPDNKIVFPLSDFLKRDYLSLIMKYIYIFR